MKFTPLFVVVLLCVAELSYSQSAGDFRTFQSGNWNNTSTWARFDGVSWINPAPSTPDATSGVITIQSPHVVTVTASGVSADQVIVANGGSLTINPGIVLTVVDGTGFDLTSAGTVNTTAESQLVFASNASYSHARNGGTVPLATWNSGTICSINGVTTAAPASLNPSGGFYHFVWDCPGQSMTVSLEGDLRTVHGDLTINNSNNQFLRIASTTTATLNIGGNFNVAGTSSRVTFTSSGSTIITVGADFNYTSSGTGAGGNGSILKDTGTFTLNIGGDLIMNAPGLGNINFSSGSADCVVNIGNNVNLTAGTFTETGTGVVNLNFSKAGTQSFTSTATILNSFNYNIAGGTTLDVLGESALSGAGTLTVNSNAVLRIGSLNAAGAIIAHPASSGNVRCTGRVYNPNARVVYAGLGPQVIGNGHPFDPNVDTEVDNINGVSFNGTASGNSSSLVMTISRNLILTQGNFNIVGTTLARTLSLNGNVIANGNFITSSGALPDIAINGSGAFGAFPFPPGAQSFRNLTFNRTSGTINFTNSLAITGNVAVNSGTVTFGGATSVTGTVSLASGGLLDFSDQSLTIGGDFSSSGGFLSSSISSNSSALTLTNSTVLTSPLAFSPTANKLNSLTLNKSNPGVSATINTALTVTNSLTLAAGQLSIVGGILSLGANATITRSSAGSIVTSSPSGGPWNVTYTGGSLSTGLELPSSGSVASVTVNSNSAAIVTLSQNLNASGILSIPLSGRTFTSGNNNVTLGGFANTGTFNAPGAAASNGLTMTGNFVNDGVFNDNGGTMIIDGTVAVSGGNIANTSFNNITINPGRTLTGGPSLNLLGNLVVNGSFTAGTGTVTFLGTVGSKTISGTTNAQFYNLTLNKSNVGLSLSVAGPSSQTVTNSLVLTAGQLNITGSSISMGSGSTISRNSAASITGTSPSGGPWNLVYTGGSLSTSLEIPVSGSVQSLTVNSSNAAVITLTQALTISGAFTNALTNRTFTSGANSVSAGSFSNAGIFNAPSSTLTLSGNFVNDGTFIHNNGTFRVAGAVTISGSAIVSTNFFNILISSGTLTSPSTLNVQGDFTNNAAFVAGTGTVIFSGNLGSRTLAGSTNTQFYNLTLNKGNAGLSLTVGSPQTVTNTFVLGAGQVDNPAGRLSLLSGATLQRVNFGTITTSSPSGGPWNLIYSNNSMTTGLEIPTSGNILSLTLSMTSGHTVTLNHSLSITNGALINAGSILTSGANAIAAASLTNNGTLNAPSTTLTLSGDITNNGTFNRGTGTVVFNGTSSHVLGSSAITFNHITISAGTLVGPATLQVAGNFTNNAAFTAGTGTVMFTGTTLQSISGSTTTNFNDIVVNNTFSPNGVQVQSNQNLVGTLTLAANAKFDADGSSNNSVFSIVSTNDSPVQDGRVATLPSGAVVNGSVSVQRYQGARDNDDRFLSSPVTNATVAQWQANGFVITGFFTGTSYPCTGCLNNGPSLNYYRESDPGQFSVGYHPTPVDNGTNAEVLVPGRGYDAWMWNGVAPTTIISRAPINQGTINFTVTRTNSVPAQPTADGWNLVGNPYPSAIQWSNTPGAWTSTSIDPTVYLWDWKINAFRTYNYSTGLGNLPNGIISTGQAFFVYASAPGAALSIMEGAKVAPGATNGYYRLAAKGSAPSVLKVSIANEDVLDESFIVTSKEYTPQFDKGGDAYKLQTGKEKLQVAPVDEENNRMIFYALRGYEKDIPLAVTTKEFGFAEISFSAENSFADYDALYLVDKYLAVQTPINSGAYRFEMTANPATIENRFVLTKDPEKIVANSLRLVCYPNPVSELLNIEINSRTVMGVRMYDNMGNVVAEIPVTNEGGLTKGTVNTQSFSSGIYILKVSTMEGMFVEKVVVH